MMFKAVSLLCTLLAVVCFFLWSGMSYWEAEAGRQEQLALHWEGEAQIAEERRLQALDAARIANEEADRQREAAANYDAIRRAIILGDADVPLPADFAAALRCLLGAGNNCEDAGGGPGDRPVPAD